MNKKEESLEEYIKFRRLTNKGRAIKDVENHIRYFLESTDKDLDEFVELDLIDYIESIKDKYSTTMLNSIKSSYLKPFIKWRFLDWSSRFRNVDKILRTEKAISKYDNEDMVSEEQFEKLIKREDNVFWKAYFLTLFYGCCRPVEVCKLERKNVEFVDDGAFITIYSSKNKENFIKFLPKKAADYLKIIYDRGHDFIFLNERTNKPLSVKGAYFQIKKLSKKALGKSCDLYTLRHSIATINYNKDNIKDDVIARQMGHTKSQKGTYVHNHKDKLKKQAKKIYMDIDELPEEKKHELEEKIKKLEDKNLEMKKIFTKKIKSLSEDYDKETERTKQLNKETEKYLRKLKDTIAIIE